MDEVALIHEAQRGGLEAFNRLVLEYQARAFNVAYRIMGDPDAAADVVQDAFVSAFRNIRAYRGGSFRAWVSRIVVNGCYDEFRRRKRRPAVSLEELTAEVDGADSDGSALLTSHEEQPEAAIERAELAEAIQGCLHGLPIEFRTVLVLVDVMDYDYEEVAHVTGKPLGTVKSRLARGRARVRDCLKGHRELLATVIRLEDEPMR